MDLFALVADKNAQFAMRGALARHEALGIREITFEIATHSGRDGGARTTGPDLLALEAHHHGASLLILDFEGSGTEHATALELEHELDERLRGLIGPRTKAIVCNPECDAWVWGSDNAISDVLDWPNHAGIRPWIQSKGFELDGNQKPLRPKEAFDAVVREARQPRSSALYQRITSTISLTRCTDDAYLRVRATLQAWFPR